MEGGQGPEFNPIEAPVMERGYSEEEQAKRIEGSQVDTSTIRSRSAQQATPQRKKQATKARRDLLPGSSSSRRDF